MTRWDRIERSELDSKSLRELVEYDLRALEIDKRIAAARQQAGLTQTALAARAGMPGSKISSLENRTQNIEVATLIRIARAANCRLQISFKR